jgi:hypothetical protein
MQYAGEGACGPLQFLNEISPNILASAMQQRSRSLTAAVSPKLDLGVRDGILEGTGSTEGLNAVKAISNWQLAFVCLSCVRRSRHFRKMQKQYAGEGACGPQQFLKNKF